MFVPDLINKMTSTLHVLVKKSLVQPASFY